MTGVMALLMAIALGQVGAGHDRQHTAGWSR